MKAALIVYAHQDSKSSFNAVLKDIALEELTAQGYQVEISDLYAQNFDPRTTRKDFTDTTLFGESVNYLNESRKALQKGCLKQEISDEIEKVRKADFVIFQFPMYWYSFPAILKGWIDKVFIGGAAFAFPNDVYDKGLFKGKKAMLSLTTGAPQSFYTNKGIHGDLQVFLWPLEHGVLRFCGFEVLKSQVSHSPAFVDDKLRQTMLKSWRTRLQDIEKEVPIRYIANGNFDQSFVLTKNYLKEHEKDETAPNIGQHLGKKLSKNQ